MKRDYHKEPYIDHSIIFDKMQLPTFCRDFLELAEQADIDDPDLYFDHVDNLLVSVKNFYAEGELSKNVWDIVKQKYYIHALEVEAREE